MKPHELYPHIAGVAYSTRETFDHSYEMGKYVHDNKIKGLIIECGVAAGANLAAMIIGNGGRNGWIGFDSFEGIQLAGSKDTEQAGIGEITHDVNVPPSELLKTSGITAYSKERVALNLIQWLPKFWAGGDIDLWVEKNLIQGWVQNTITEPMPKDMIAILRLDMDVYDPTMHCLRMMYDAVTVGGVIIIDDWALAGVRTAVMEFWTERGLKPEIKQVPNSTPIYWIKE
jgi:hypothetical protein